MMINPFMYLNQMQKGMFLIACGILILILQAVGFLQTIFGALVIIAAAYMIIYGAWLSKLHLRAKELLAKYGVKRRK